MVPPRLQLPSPPGGVPFPTTTKPLFNQEGPQYYAQAAAHNQPFTKPGPTQTVLPPSHETLFRAWVANNKIPFDPNAKSADYDMRGYWLSLQHGGQGQGANGHFPDTFKTPLDTTFSGESRYAKPGTPFVWVGNTLIDSRNGQVIYGGQ